MIGSETPYGRDGSRPMAEKDPHLSLQRIPTLRNPVLVMAFEGWNDSGEAATTGAQLLVSEWEGSRFASMDPEDFFVFTETRPHVRLNRRGRRRIEWPSNEFYACINPSSDPDAHDLIVLLGTEPDLRWRTFSDIVLDVARRAGVQLIVGLGALDADVPHTMPPVVSGSVANPELHPSLKGLGLKQSKYEGPTGIVGVLTSRFAAAGYPTLSLWGHSPHYISASPNPVVASRIVHELARVLQLSLDMAQLDENAARFDEQVREAVSKDPEAMAYVRDLERRVREDGEADDEGPRSGSSGAAELPNATAMVDYLEEFLRKQRKDPSGG